MPPQGLPPLLCLEATPPSLHAAQLSRSGLLRVAAPRHAVNCGSNARAAAEMSTGLYLSQGMASVSSSQGLSASISVINLHGHWVSTGSDFVGPGVHLRSMVHGAAFSALRIPKKSISTVEIGIKRETGRQAPAGRVLRSPLKQVRRWRKRPLTFTGVDTCETHVH